MKKSERTQIPPFFDNDPKREKPPSIRQFGLPKECELEKQKTWPSLSKVQLFS